MALAAFCVSPAWAQAPNWVLITEGESLFIDAESITQSQDAPEGQKWLNFDVVLNTPVPESQEDAASLNAFFGADPKTFFNHVTLNCDDMSVRENTSGIAYGAFQTPRRNADGKPLHAFELDQLIEYDLHSQPQFESIVGTPEAERYGQLVCQTSIENKDSGASLALLKQAIPNISTEPELLPLRNYPHKFIDKSSIRQRANAATIKDFNIVYHMPEDDPQFTQATAPYGVDSFTMVFDRTINCASHSMRSNYRAIAPDYRPNARLLEYRPQEDAAYLAMTAEERELYDVVCPRLPPVTHSIEIKPVAPTSAPAKPAAPFKTDYD